MKTTTKKKTAKPLTLHEKGLLDIRDKEARHVRLSLSELATMMNVNRSTIWRRIRAGDFPPPGPDGYSVDDIIDAVAGLEVELDRMQREAAALQAPAAR